MKSIARHFSARQLEQILIIGFVLIMVLLPVHAFLSTWGGTRIGPLLVWKSWKEILLLALVIPAGLYLVKRPKTLKLLWSRPINKLVLIYIGLNLIEACFSRASSAATIAGLLIDLRFFGMFLLAQLIATSDHPWMARLKSAVPTWLFGVTIFLSIVAMLQVVVLPQNFLNYFGYNKDTTISPISTLDNTPGALRAFATMRGPNTLGEFLLIPLAFAFSLVIERRALSLAGTTLGLGLITLLLTGSRSAWLGCVITLLIVVLFHFPPAQVKRWTKRLVLPILLGLGVLLLATTTIPPLRLAIFHSSAIHGPSLIEGSTENHWLATVNGLRYIATHPLGTGVGSAGPASFYNQNAKPLISEDYYIQIGEEVGVIGLALFIAICCLTARQLSKSGDWAAKLLFASFIGLSIVNLFLHGWADDPTAMIWWGLAGLFIGDFAKPAQGHLLEEAS